MNSQSDFAALLAGIRSGDTVSLLIALGLFMAVGIILAVAVNMRAARRNRDTPAAKWGKNSSRYRK